MSELKMLMATKGEDISPMAGVNLSICERRKMELEALNKPFCDVYDPSCDGVMLDKLSPW